MAKHILMCKKCNSYTMKETCQICGERTLSVRPPKYSPEDKFAKYRRKAKFGDEEDVNKNDVNKDSQ